MISGLIAYLILSLVLYGCQEGSSCHEIWHGITGDWFLLLMVLYGPVLWLVDRVIDGMDFYLEFRSL